MATVSMKTCDQCGEVIKDGVRRFSLGASLTIHNGHDRAGEVAVADICSDHCLLGVVSKLLRDVQEMPLVKEAPFSVMVR